MFGSEQDPTANPADSGVDREAGGPQEVPYGEIRKALRPKLSMGRYPERGRGRARVHVPDEVLALIPAWAAALREAGYTPVAEQRIPYGVKVRVRHGDRVGVINIFYGKRGFRFAVENQRGTDAPTAQEAVAVIEDTVYEIGTRLAGLPEGDEGARVSFLTAVGGVEGSRRSTRSADPSDATRADGPQGAEAAGPTGPADPRTASPERAPRRDLDDPDFEIPW